MQTENEDLQTKNNEQISQKSEDLNATECEAAAQPVVSQSLKTLVNQLEHHFGQNDSPTED